MYNSVSFYRVRLFDVKSGERIIPWRDHIHIDHGGGYYALEEYLTYLSEVRGITVSGVGVVASWQIQETFEVRNSVVVPRHH